MKPGSICTLKNRRNTRKPVFVAVYPDLELLLESRLKKNETIISTTTEKAGTLMTSTVKPWGLKDFGEMFVLLREVVDSYGHFYYECLYGDTRMGWIVKDKNFQLLPLPEEMDQTQDANKNKDFESTV